MRWLERLTAIRHTRWIGYAAALATVAAVSGLIAAVPQRADIANISMLYLIPVLATASLFGRRPALLAAAAAFLTFNWFFVEPLHTFDVADPEEWVALLLFLATALVTGQLAASQRQRAWDAQQREREAVVLHDVVRLMVEPDLDHALREVAERLRRELDLAAVIVEVADGLVVAGRAVVGEPEALRLARAAAMTSTHFLVDGASPTGAQPGARGRWIRVVPPRPTRAGQAADDDRLHVVPVKSHDRQVGALHLVRRPAAPAFGEADDRLLSAVATQLGTAVERVRLQHEATEAEVLRRTDELKSALLSAVSHDLRTPLASIIASAGSLRQKEVAWSDEEQQGFAEAIEEEARRLNRIVGNLLDLSRIEAGSLHPEKEWHDLGALVDDVVGRLRPAIAQHHLMVDVQEDLPPVLLDYVEIDQVLSNLIENAAKYTPPGTEIVVSARPVDGDVRIEVADRGPGIPSTVLPRLFAPFYQAWGRGPRPKGTGLGLAVARGLVEAHGGRITAENRPGGGACFAFTLPLSLPVAVPPMAGEQQA